MCIHIFEKAQYSSIIFVNIFRNIWMKKEKENCFVENSFRKIVFGLYKSTYPLLSPEWISLICFHEIGSVTTTAATAAAVVVPHWKWPDDNFVAISIFMVRPLSNISVGNDMPSTLNCLPAIMRRVCHKISRKLQCKKWQQNTRMSRKWRNRWHYHNKIHESAIYLVSAACKLPNIVDEIIFSVSQWLASNVIG